MVTETTNEVILAPTDLSLFCGCFDIGKYARPLHAPCALDYTKKKIIESIVTRSVPQFSRIYCERPGIGSLLNCPTHTNKQDQNFFPLNWNFL